VDIDFAFLANYAEASPNGLVTAVGAGWDNAWQAAYPAPSDAPAVACRTPQRGKNEDRH
jgi:hypothetical protein